MAAFSERALAAVSLALRVLTLLLLIASLIIMVTDKIYVGPFSAVEDPPNFTFRDRLAYRYVVSAAVIGCAYTLLVLPFAVIHLAQGRKIGRGGATVVLIFTDVVFAMLIATGAAAGLGLTVEAQRFPEFLDSDSKKFLNMVDLSCGLMLGATVCMVFMITISAHLLI
ncbi:CASP-like protein 4D1 [Sorghum bicolor]|uniref:CASP-like protein n=1 Tax=Sorghum bicolor TaxID=4558 RepID=A0A1Z5RJ45_SORBI|nr:CASP-like protein 4D1 [Sorghum bicolor]OQU83619.1 hypothetical protein SORBI_3005G146533 [Sorghum bicolor]|eukprot:XP_002450918.1 CASP-like protein 4D1 [Sorghum bicolor]